MEPVSGVSSRASIGAEQEEQELVEVFSSMLDKSMPAGRAEPGWRSGGFGEVGKDEEVKEKIRVLARASLKQEAACRHLGLGRAPFLRASSIFVLILITSSRAL